MGDVTKYSKKVVLLGDGAVGKTSLVGRFIEGKFSDEYIKTIGAKYSKKEIAYSHQNAHVTLLIGDILGQHGYENTQASNIRGANAALMVCDITKPETAESLEKYWIPLLGQVSKKMPPLVFLINKSDLVNAEDGVARKTCGEILKLANTYNSKMHITSARTGANVNEAFKEIGILTLNFNSDPFGYNPELYRVDGAISPKKALDLFQAQLYNEIGGENFVGSILKKQVTDAGIDVSLEPTPKQLEDLVERFREVETLFLSDPDLKNYYSIRRGILAKVVA